MDSGLAASACSLSALNHKLQGSFWVLLVAGEEELLEKVLVIGSFWHGSGWTPPFVFVSLCNCLPLSATCESNEMPLL